jgi:hypothetical protein
MARPYRFQTCAARTARTPHAMPDDTTQAHKTYFLRLRPDKCILVP